MHYDISRTDEPVAFDELHAALENAGGGAPPAGVQQRHDPFLRGDQVNRDAIGHADGEQQAASARGMPVHAVEDEPAVLTLAVPLQRGPVDLMAQHDPRERGVDGGPERPPAGHHLSHVLLAPQSEREAAPPGRDARHDPVAVRPLDQLHAGRSGDGPAITARWGSHSTMRAPMPMSLSTKNRRDSNSFSNTNSRPSHCEATTIAIDIKSAGKAGHGPSSSFGTWPPRSGRMRRSWSASTTSFAPSRRGRTPSRSNAMRVARKSSGRTPSIVTAPFVTAASPRNDPISMWSGPIANGVGGGGAPPDGTRPSIVNVLVPIPSTVAPRPARNRTKSWTCGSHAALRSTVLPGAPNAAMRAFSVAVTLGSSRKMSAAASLRASSL